ncbi:hypothetical protein FB45DRAFT_298242 [Roridomyces roridus]|uniref:Uncharacterized protein n=1 Tax=Roridomyces roridus TaxID=1738132 RepID=A0AAD7CBW1_9AGAR|nr:hypothetical protein FB45DRAFT_298242 [Roridomyces roridus]
MEKTLCPGGLLLIALQDLLFVKRAADSLTTLQSKDQGCHQIVLLFVGTSCIVRASSRARNGSGGHPHPNALAGSTPTTAAQCFLASRNGILAIRPHRSLRLQLQNGDLTLWVGRASPAQSFRMRILSCACEATEHEELIGPGYSLPRYPHHTSTASTSSYLTLASPRRRWCSIHGLALLPPRHLSLAVAVVGLAALSPNRSAPASWSRTIRPGGSASMAREGRASRAGAILSSR